MQSTVLSQLGLTPTKFKSVVQVYALPLLLLVTAVKAEIRCYCNQPACVSTGYMCKSAAGQCFTELFSYSSELSKSRHGCVELLGAPQRTQCKTPVKGQVPALPVLFCCREDMCNYMNTMDINIEVHTRTNHSQIRGAYDSGAERQAYETALHQDIWFKAAVIAVPIAGGFILVLLVLLAARMLRQDSKRQRQLLQLRRQQRFGKARFDHCQQRPTHKSKHMYRNMNLALSSDSCCADLTTTLNERHFVCDKSACERNYMCTTLLPWTKWHPQNTSTLV